MTNYHWCMRGKANKHIHVDACLKTQADPKKRCSEKCPHKLSDKEKKEMAKEKETTTAIKPYDQIVTGTMNRIAAMQNNNLIQFPGDYSPQNALQSAWLILQETTDREKKPVLDVCTKVSIANSLLDMVVQGLNPIKKQCYFIAYGKTLSCQRSYFGAMAVAKRADPTIEDIAAEVIFKDDDFKFGIVDGRRQIREHTQTLESMAGPVKGAYCLVIGKGGEIKRTDIMTFDEIKKAWKKSKMNPVLGNGEIKEGSVHGEFLVEMCRKTVINRTCKAIINSSSDKTLLESVNRQEFAQAEEGAAAQIEEGANQTFIDIEPEPAGSPPADVGPGPHVGIPNEPEEPKATGTDGPDF